MQIDEIKKQFLGHVEMHEIVDWHEKGVIRYLKCQSAVEPHAQIYDFEITTWPHYLSISGDMGCFRFSRLGTLDMFEFFRRMRELQDLKYIRENLVVNENAGYEEFCKKTLDESLLDLASDTGRSIESLREIFRGCESEAEVDEAYFKNFDDPHAIPCCTRYTYRYLWCVCAIVWAIEQYDKMNMERSIGE